MAQCVQCQAGTERYENDVPICLRCTYARTTIARDLLIWFLKARCTPFIASRRNTGVLSYMTVGRSEAFDLLSKWFTEGTLLKVTSNFPKVATALRGRIFSLTDKQVGVVSDEKPLGEIVFKVDSDCWFGYGDPRNIPEEREAFGGALVILFPPDGEDVITLGEIL